MTTMRIPSGDRRGARIYLLVIAIVMVCLLGFRSPEKTLDIAISPESGDQAVAEINYTPRLSLPAGVYEFQLRGGASASGRITILTADGTVRGEGYANESDAVIAVSLERDESNLIVRSEPDDPESAAPFTYVKVVSDSPIFTDGVLLAALILLGLLAVGWARYLCPAERRASAVAAALVAASVLIASYPMFTNYLQYGHDLNFHLWRIEGIKDGLLSGQFPVRVHPTHNSGYGYITASVYPELFLYLPAALRLLGVSSITAYKALLFAMNLAAAGIMYHSMKKMSGSTTAAALAAAIYTLSTWRAANMYHRAAIGEALGMVFFPLAILGIHYILKGDKSKWYVLAIACTCVFQSHVISTVLLAMLLAVVCLVHARELFREGRFLSLVKAAALTVFLNLWYLVPFAYYYFSLDMAIHHTPFNTEFFSNAIIPAQLFNVFNDNFGYSYLLPVGIRGDMSLSLGAGVTLCLAAGAFHYMLRRDKKELGGLWFTVFASGLALTLMATSLFPWETLQRNALINKFAGTVRMPWRFLSLASPLLCMTGARILTKHRKPEWRKGAAVAVCVVCALTFVPFGAAFTTSYDAHMRKGMAVPEGGAVGWDREYYLTTTDTNALTPNLYRTSDESVRVTAHEKSGSNIDLTLTGATDGAYVEVPLLYYPGYGAKDGAGESLAVEQGANDVVRVLLRGDTTEVRVSYRGLPAFKIASWLSALTLALFIARLCLRRRRARRA